MNDDLSKEVLEENKNKIKNLHEAAVKLENMHDKDEVYQFSIETAENILNFYMSTILIEGEGGLVVRSSHSKGIEKGAVLDKEDGIYGLTYMNEESYLINDLDEFPEAAPYNSDFNSVISVPIGDYGVFQVISVEKDYFNEYELEMAKILVKHIEEAVKRIEFENELKKREERYRLITENSNDMISLINKKGEIIFANEAHERILGYSKDELEGKETIELIHPNFKDKVECEVDKLIDKSQKRNIEAKIKCKDGEYIWIESNIHFFDEKQTPEQFVIVSRDITKRKKAEKKLREAEKLYKNIFENTGNPTLIVEDDMTISLVNKEFTKLTGYEKEEVENKMDLSDFIIEEDLKKIKEYHQDRRDDPDSTPSEYSFRIINKFGHPLDVYCKVGLIPNSTKRITSIIDVSKYRETMQELRKCQETFRVIFENMPYDMILLDSDLNIIEVNPKLLDILRYNEGELSGQSILDILTSKSEHKLKENKENLQENRSDTEKQKIKIFNNDDETVDFTLTMSVVLDTQDEPIYFICDVQKE